MKAIVVSCGLLWLTILSACSGSNVHQSNEPRWLRELIDSMKNAEYNQSAFISKYFYHDETVYYMQAPCCDQMNPLFDADGNLLCYPDGGFSGRGDGKCPEFRNGAELLEVLWQQGKNYRP